MIIRFTLTAQAEPIGKIADAELLFEQEDGALAGLKLIGFQIWERKVATVKDSHSGRNVTFPARQYTVNAERRSFAVLRPIADVHAQWAVRDAILKAYAADEQAFKAVPYGE
jgi:hypothetical protein